MLHLTSLSELRTSQIGCITRLANNDPHSARIPTEHLSLKWQMVPSISH